MPEGIDYTAEEWATSAGHFPLAPCGYEELLLLHRHWLWANQQRDAFDRALRPEDLLDSGPAILATISMGFMLAWYGLLWSVIEACIVDRRLDIQAAFLADIDALSDILRRCRNAVLHVPRGNELIDSRIEQLVTTGDAPTTIRRIHRGFGRLFLEELDRRRRAERDAPRPASE